jgi:NAD(P)-dependent dehydrogenase (short-subunit alcohol dehydrogenase family)
MKVIRDKAALVTGAASGIGRAVALALAREGARLFLVDIDAERLARTVGDVEKLGADVVPHVCDLTDPKQISAAVSAVVARFGHLDILVNNAGVTYYGPTEAMTAAQWNELLALNLLAPVQLLRELLPTLLAQPESHIVNMSSVFGLVPMGKLAAYETSKFGLVGLSLALRAEFKERHCGVSVLCPGFVRTAMIEKFVSAGFEPQYRIPAWMCTTADDVADEAIRAICDNKGLVVISKAARVLWAFTRLSPALRDWLIRLAWRRMLRSAAKAG